MADERIPLAVTLDGERWGHVKSSKDWRPRHYLFGQFGDWRTRTWSSEDFVPDLRGGGHGNGRGLYYNHWTLGENHE